MKGYQRTAALLWFLLVGVIGRADLNSQPGGGGGSGGSGGVPGTGGTPGPETCGQGSLEDDDSVDAITGLASGTVSGSCETVGEMVECNGPDLIDEFFLEVVEDGTERIQLNWVNSSSDLDLAVLDPTTCEVIDASANRAGTEESINVFLEAGTEPIIAILAVDTNNSAEPYELMIGTGAE